MPTTLTHTDAEFPKSWKKTADAYSEDHLIDAYLRGVKDGRSKYEKILMAQLHNNLNVVGQATEALINETLKLEIPFAEIHLSADNIDSFTILGVVDEKDFVTDEFRSVFTIARSIKNENEKNEIYLIFTFVPYSPKLNQSCIVSDGYAWKYAKIPRTPESR